MEKKTNWLCLACSQEFDPKDPRILDKNHPNHGGCPGCGYAGIPADLSQMLSVNITWHELRCLVIWAERWANEAGEEKETMLRIFSIASWAMSQIRALFRSTSGRGPEKPCEEKDSTQKYFAKVLEIRAPFHTVILTGIEVPKER